ncbi:hypothetical protein KMP13_09040 [Epibacterium ulvae]|uniref:hypothetical protein n=1 Tax=Epibacterium ulvae TaxID=1156985 RepID=UPI001BFCA13A|nr:hypothetical protein [Epibacterium ulvae]MBT8154039.1 hypothetical protein [Epibacterium ulvae]
MTDLHILRHAFRPLDKSDTDLIKRAHKVITVALWGLWITGLGLFYLKTNGDLAAASPKLWAKLATVTLLTATAIGMARVAVPIVTAVVGQRLIDLGLGKKLMLASFAAMSAAGWLTALLLGGAETTRTADFTTLGTILATSFGLAQLISCSSVVLTHFLPSLRQSRVMS